MATALEQAKQSPLPEELRTRPRLRRQSQQQEPSACAPHTPQRAPSAQSGRRSTWRLAAAGAAAALLLAAALYAALPSGEDAPLSTEAAPESCGHDCSAEDALAGARRQVKQLRAEQARLKKAATEAEGLRAELRRQRQDAAALAKQAKGADAVASRLRRELQAAEDALADSREQLQELKQANGELRSQAAGAAASERQLAALRSELQAAREQARQAGEAARAGAGAEQRLQLCHKQLDDSQALVKALSSRTDSCWQTAERAKESALRWQLRSVGASAAVVLLCALFAASYRRYLQRQVWRLTTEKGRLSAALRLAQTGLGERLQGGRR